jgi:hypothetical protein
MTVIIISQKEWNDRETYYIRLLEDLRKSKEQSKQMVQELTQGLNKKNEEIQKLNFLVEVLTLNLKVTSEVLQVLKSQEKVRQNG